MTIDRNSPSVDVTEADARVTEAPTSFVLACPSCKEATLAVGLSAVASYNPDNGPPSRYTFVRCSRCGDPAVLAQEDYGQGWDEPLRVWPQPPRFFSYAIPAPLRSEAEQARRCFDARAYTAVVVMVRRTLEGVCREHGVTKQPLAAALKDMKAQGHLDDRLLAWSDGLRVLGNQGAHYTGDAVSAEDARDALDLAEAMLDYIYVLTARFNEFNARRARPIT